MLRNYKVRISSVASFSLDEEEVREILDIPEDEDWELSERDWKEASRIFADRVIENNEDEIDVIELEEVSKRK